MAAAGRRGRITAAVVGAVVLLVLVGSAVTMTAIWSGRSSGNPVVTIRVIDETYRVELADPEALATARQLLAGEIGPKIPTGLVVRDDPGPNAPWSWHIDPATFEWADQTTEVCDGLPSFVEDGTVTSPYYCPWSAEVIAIG